MPSIHASCVELSAGGVLIRGPSGAGKSSLALALLEDAALRGEPALLVADDRVLLEVAAGALIARPAEALAGLIERWGLGIERRPHATSAMIVLVVDLVEAAALCRMPEETERQTEICGLVRPRLAVGPDSYRSVPLVRAALAAL